VGVGAYNLVNCRVFFSLSSIEGGRIFVGLWPGRQVGVLVGYDLRVELPVEKQERNVSG
jgi:hypothetical protein